MEPPSTTLEDSAPGVEIPSPIAQMVLHCNLIRMIEQKKITIPPGEMSCEDDIAFCDEVKSWMATFPPPLRVTDPEKQFDATNPYVILHRAQLHTVAYAIMLHPLKRYLSRNLSSSATTMEKGLRSRAVDCALSSLEGLQAFFNVVAPIYTKLHFLIFGIFDIGTLLCSAISHDDGQNLPRREEIIKSIGSALEMLRKVHKTSRIGILPYSILRQLASSLPRLKHQDEILSPDQHKKPKITSLVEESASSEAMSSSKDRIVVTPTLPSGQYSLSQVDTGDSSLSSEFLGDMNSFVDWEGLDLGPLLNAGSWSAGADFR